MYRNQQKLFEKCAECHLFVEINADHAEDSTLAPYLHLYGACALCEETNSSHDAVPSGEIHDLAYWREYGPELMLNRFDAE